MPLRTPSTGCRSDRKSTRLNSSHGSISYAVFCLKKKRNHETKPPPPRNPNETNTTTNKLTGTTPNPPTSTNKPTHQPCNRLDDYVRNFFFNDTATTDIYTLSLHDALPIFIITKKGALVGNIQRPTRVTENAPRSGN